MNINRNRNNYSVEKCIDYLNDKYNDEFFYAGSYDESQPTANTLKIFARNNKYDKKITVISSNSNPPSIGDNYMAIVYEEKVKEMLEDIAREVYGECKVIYNVLESTTLPDDITKDTSFDTYIHHDKISISWDILLPVGYDTQGKEEKLSLVNDKIKEKDFHSSVDVYYVCNESDYNDIKSKVDIGKKGFDHWYDLRSGVYEAKNDEDEEETYYKDWVNNTDKHEQTKEQIVEEKIEDSLYTSFYAAVYKKSLQSVLANALNIVYGVEEKVIYENSDTFVLPEDWDKNTIIYYYLPDANNEFHAYFVLPAEITMDARDEQLDKLRQVLCMIGFNGTVDIYYAKDTESFESVNTVSDINNKSDDWYKEKISITITVDDIMAYREEVPDIFGRY